MHGGYWFKKLLGLPLLIKEYEEQIEFDLHRYHGLTLDDYWQDRVSPRLLLIYIEQLPAESAYKQKLSKETPAEWSITDHLLANVCDLLARANWQRQGKRHAQKPKPLPRPGKRPTIKSKYGSAEGWNQTKLRKFLDSKKPRQEAGP